MRIIELPDRIQGLAMTDTEKTEPLAIVKPSASRFWFGVIVMFGLGFFLTYLALFGARVSSLAQAALLLFAAVTLFHALTLFRVGRRSVILTDDGIFDSDGNVLCSMDQIENVDRGAFAFKPSNGFLLRLNVSLGRAWHPGLWWRIGNRVGVGGITSASEAKVMADIIMLTLKERRGELPNLKELFKK